MADEAARAQTLTDKGGGGLQDVGGVWAQLKVLLTMGPRRSLMFGGLRELEAEAEGRDVSDPNDGATTEEGEEAPPAA
eukprot:4803236-Prymnesium_polylepis.1